MQLEFKQICALFGGPSRVNKILGLKDDSARDVRRAMANNKPRKVWIDRLRKYAKEHAKELLDFSENV